MCQMRLSEEDLPGAVPEAETPAEKEVVLVEGVADDPRTFMDGSVSFTWDEWEGGLCAKAEAALGKLYDEGDEPQTFITSDGQEVPAVVVFDESDLSVVAEKVRGGGDVVFVGDPSGRTSKIQELLSYLSDGAPVDVSDGCVETIMAPEDLGFFKNPFPSAPVDRVLGRLRASPKDEGARRKAKAQRKAAAKAKRRNRLRRR